MWMRRSSQNKTNPYICSGNKSVALNVLRMRKRVREQRHAEQDLIQVADAGREHKSLGDRDYCDAGHVHGSAGHLHCQRGIAAYFRQFVGGRGRVNMGAYVVPGFQRDCAAAFRMVLFLGWAQAVLHVLRRAVHGQLVSVRPGAEPGRARDFSYFTRYRRWWFAAQRAGHLERHVFGRKARHGLRSVRNRGGRRADDRPLARRLDYGQFFVALDFLYQRAGGNHFAFADLRTNQRSALHEARQPQKRFPDRLHRHWPDQLGPGQHADHFGQGPARRLVVVRLHPLLFRDDDYRHRGRDFLGAATEGTSHRSAHVEESELHDRHHRHVFPGLRDVCQHGSDPAILAANDGVHSGTRGTSAVARWRGDYVHDAGCGLLGVESTTASTDYVWRHHCGLLSLRDGRLGLATGLWSRGARAHAAGLGLGVLVYSHQRVRVCLRTEGNEQYGHRDYQSGAQYRRQCWYCHRHNHVGAAHASASGAIGRAYQHLQRGVPQHAEWHADEVGVRGLQPGARNDAGTADDLWNGPTASDHAGVYRQFQDARRGAFRHHSGVLAAEEAEQTSRQRARALNQVRAVCV